MGNLGGGLGQLLPFAENGGLFTAVGSNSNPDKTFTHWTSFDEEFPAYLIRKPDATYRKTVIPHSFVLTPSGTAPGGKIKIAVFKDQIDRFDQMLAGSLLEYGSPGLEDNRTPSFNVYANIGALDASSKVQILDYWEQELLDTSPIQYSFDGRARLEKVGSILVFVWAGAVGLTVKPTFVIVEEGHNP